MSKYIRKDRLYLQAKQEGLRARSSYKLEELNRRFRFLRPKSTILDLGCAPGGWLQVAARNLGEQGLIIGLDKEAIDPFTASELAGAKPPIILQRDVFDESLVEELRSLAPQGFNAVLSDMSPALSGLKLRDNVRSVELVSRVLEIAEQLLIKSEAGSEKGIDKGIVVAKLFPGVESDRWCKDTAPKFRQFNRVILDSTRNSSKELYIVGRGLKTKD